MERKRCSSRQHLVRRPNPYADNSVALRHVCSSFRTGEYAGAFWAKRFFATTVWKPDAIPMDLPVGPEYVVGPGDGLPIMFWGGISAAHVSNCGSRRRITLPEAGPLLVSGRSLGDVQRTFSNSCAHSTAMFGERFAFAAEDRPNLRGWRWSAEPGSVDISSLFDSAERVVRGGWGYLARLVAGLEAFIAANSWSKKSTPTTCCCTASAETWRGWRTATR